MADIFHLPRIGDAMTEGEIVEWFVTVGDTVDLDQIICSIETDKSVVELTTPHRGAVLQLGGAVGDTLQVGDPILTVGQAGEAVAEPAPTAAPAPAAATPPASAPTSHAPANGSSPVVSPIIRRLAVDQGVDLSTVVGTGAGGRITRADVAGASQSAAPQATSPSTQVRAMPKVRKAARERGIDLRAVTGSGPDGSITAVDVEAIVNGGATKGLPGGARRERMSPIRRAIATHLTESATTIPQFTSTVDVDATAVLATRQALRERLDKPVPIDALFMALLIPVLRDHPRMHAWLDEDEIEYHPNYNIGVAVDTPDGLVVPVVSNADSRSIAELSDEIMRLAAGARDRALQPTELSGATCTVNNVGAVGIETGTPILPLRTSTIVAYGRTRPVVQLRNGNPVEVPTITVCATFDHRLVDGGDAGRFLTQLRQHLEVPALGLL